MITRFLQLCKHKVFSQRINHFQFLVKSDGSRRLFSLNRSTGKELSFDNPEEAFKSKTNYQLIRGYLVYSLCSSNFIVNNNIKLMKLCQKVFGKRVFEAIMKMTAYGHFVAGENHQAIKSTLSQMNKFGVHPILDYSVEEDLSEEEAVKREFEGTVSETERMKSHPNLAQLQESCAAEPYSDKHYQMFQQFGDRRKTVSSARTYFYLNETVCDRNLDIFKECVQNVGSGKYGPGVAAIKLTALGRPQLLLQISNVIMKARQFVAEVSNIEDKHKNILQFHLTEAQLAKRLEKRGIKDTNAFLKNVIKDKEGVMHLFPWNGIIDKNLDLSETFRIPSLKDGKMVRLITQLTRAEEEMFRNMIKRLHELFNLAIEKNVPVMIDAEQTYFQPAISRIAMEMMHIHNTEKLIVMNTYQCYLKDIFNEVQNDMEQARRENFYFGAKLVRGAYLEQERARAKDIGYPDPTNPTFEATTQMYYKTLNEVLKRIQHGKEIGNNKIRIMIATHNEETVRYAIKKCAEYNINPKDGSIFFGQLLGMCDYITFPLGQSGYLAYKYVPYGPVSDVLPYLSRRVVENKGVLQNVKKEKELLIKELTRRFKAGKIFYKPPIE